MMYEGKRLEFLQVFLPETVCSDEKSFIIFRQEEVDHDSLNYMRSRRSDSSYWKILSRPRLKALCSQDCLATFSKNPIETKTIIEINFKSMEPLLNFIGQHTCGLWTMRILQTVTDVYDDHPMNRYVEVHFEREEDAVIFKMFNEEFKIKNIEQISSDC